MTTHKSAVPTPAPTGGRRNKASRIKNTPQQMLEEANATFKNTVEILQQFQEYLDPAAIDPKTVRRLTVEMRTSANALKKFAHKLEQHHAQRNAPAAAATAVEGNNQTPAEEN